MRVTASSVPSASSAALTVTIWAVFQLEVVKVRVLVGLKPSTVRSVESWPLTVTVTSSDGSVDSFTM